MEYYTSILNNTIQVNANTAKIKLDEKIIEQFTCPISSNMFKFPVALPSGSIYDKSSIIEWLTNHNTDPLSNLELPLGTIKLIPVLNYYLFLNCLEKTNDSTIIFRPPYGCLYTFLEITKHFLDNYILDVKSNAKYCCFRKNKTVLYTKQRDLPIPPNTISHDLRDYLPYCEDSKFEEILPQPSFTDSNYVTPFEKYIEKWKYITIEEILGTCCITGRSIRGNTMLTNDGMLIHSAFKSYYNTASCSAFISGIVRNAPKIVIFNDNILDAINIPLNTNNFTIICEYDPQNKKDPIYITDDLEVIDIHCTYRLAPNLSLYNYFKEPIDKHDWYLDIQDTPNIIYNKYQKDLKTIDNNAIILCNKLTNFDFRDYSLTKEFQRNRQSLGLPTYESTYALDYSFLTLKTDQFSTSEDKYLKMCYFVGTHFDSVVFKSVSFSCCVFIACTGLIIFVDCEFDTSNGTQTSFYKAEANINFVGNTKMSKRTYEELPFNLKMKLK
jgi:hypothetical protein